MEYLEKAVIEINRYMECHSFSIDIESCEIATKAIEKQMPKNVEKKGEMFMIAPCPNCSATIRFPSKYCIWCGQKLDWGD